MLSEILRSIVFGVVLFASMPLSFGQTQDYFPLEVGNNWVYRWAGNAADPDEVFKTISVEGKDQLGGQEYFRVSYFGRAIFLRIESSGTLVSFNRASGTEDPWVALGTPEGGSFETSIDECAETGTIESRNASVPTPAGTFQNAIQVRYRGSCADRGVTQQAYAPGVGLVSHEETSFAGPRRYELTYFRSGLMSITGPEISFGVGLDAPRYTVGSNMGVRMTLRSTHRDPVKLVFGGQLFDVKIFDQSGNTAFVWSEGRQFPLIIREEMFGPGEKTFAVAIPLGTLPPGRYKAQGYLTTQPAVMYLGEVSFEIVEVQTQGPGQ